MGLFKEAEKKHFILVTEDFGGLGYAKKFIDEGADCLIAFGFNKKDDEKITPSDRINGKGLAERMPIEELWPKRMQYKNSYWIFDSNNVHSAKGDQLRKEGFARVFGGRALTVRMEDDRDFGVSLIKKAGLKSPETLEFQTKEEGMEFLDANEQKAYVFKPNDNKNGWETYVPDSEKDKDANDELHSYLEALPDGNSGGYILQERIRGVEANFELWLYKGTPYFAICELECKKKNNDDYGGLCGGSQDINFAVPIKSRGIRETVEKLLVLPEFKDYSGFLDMNVIVHDNGPYFLEFCARFGYPEHLTALFALAKKPVSEILSMMIDGKVEHFYDNFKHGFAAGITLYNNSPRKGLPIYVPEDLEKQFYVMDGYKRGEKLFTAGCGPEVGYITAHGFTVMDAAEEAIAAAKKVAFPNRAFRTDLDKDAYPSNPRDRYLALEAMRYLVE